MKTILKRGKLILLMLFISSSPFVLMATERIPRAMGGGAPGAPGGGGAGGGGEIPLPIDTYQIILIAAAVLLTVGAIAYKKLSLKKA